MAPAGAVPDQGIASWSLRDIASEDDIDGVPTYRSTSGPVEPDQHPNGTTEIDHVVLMSHNPHRTVAALEQRGFDVRRVRDAGNGMEQTFFKTREVVIELIGPREPSEDHFDKRAHFYGLAFTVADLDATAALLGERLGRVKDAVQPGRASPRSARSAAPACAIAFMSPGRPRSDRTTPCSTTSSPTPSARCATPSRRPSSSGRPSRSGSRSTCCSATPRGRPPTACPARACRRGCRPTSRSTGRRGRRRAYRSWYIGEPSTRRPASRSRSSCASSAWPSMPDVKPVLAVLPETSPPIGDRARSSGRARPSRSALQTTSSKPQDWALEVSYEGSYELDEATLADGSILDDHFSAMGGWIASTLVRLGDLELDFLPADEEELHDRRPCSVEVADARRHRDAQPSRGPQRAEPRAAAGPPRRPWRRREADDGRASSCSPAPTPRSAPGSTSRSWRPAGDALRDAAPSGDRRVAADRAVPAPMAKPVIGAVNGVAITGGFELALACDFLVASERARFADTHARVGIMPGWGLTVLLPEAIGVRRAKEMSHHRATSSTADRRSTWGLVNHVVPHDELLPFCRQLAADIASNRPRRGARPARRVQARRRRRRWPRASRSRPRTSRSSAVGSTPPRSKPAAPASSTRPHPGLRALRPMPESRGLPPCGRGRWCGRRCARPRGRR